MKLKKLIWILIPASLLCILLGCKDDDVLPVKTIPEPEEITYQEGFPDTDNNYYLIESYGGPRFDERDSIDSLFYFLQSKGIELKEAYSPLEGTPCMAATAVGALVVITESPDARIEEFGFIAEPGHWIINCGINEFYFYDFR